MSPDPHMPVRSFIRGSSNRGQPQLHEASHDARRTGLPLVGRVALVTGASKGLGRASALELARLGVDVALLARDVGALEEVAGLVHGGGRRAVVLPADVTDQPAVDRAVRETVERLGGLDVLVSAAGVMGSAAHVLFLDLSLDEWSRTVAVNLTGAFIVAQAACRVMAERGSGVVVNISSGAAGRAGFLTDAYGVSKAGLERLTAGIAEGLRDRDVKAVAFRPSFMNTPGTRALYDVESLRGTRSPEDNARIVGLLATHPGPFNGRAVRAADVLGELGLDSR